MQNQLAPRKRGRPVTTGTTPRTSFRLDDETRQLLALLASRMKQSKTDVVKNLIHQASQREKRTQRANVGMRQMTEA